MGKPCACNVQPLTPCPASTAIPTYCSNISEGDITVMNWIRVTGAVAEYLVVGILLAYVLIRREYKSVLERLFIYLMFAILLRETLLIFNVGHKLEHPDDQVCSIFGALNFYATLPISIIVASIIIYLLKSVAYQKLNSAVLAKTLEFSFVTLTFFIPLLFSVGLFYTGVFSSSTAWCWVRKYNNQCQKTSPLKQIVIGYGHAFVLTGILCIILTASVIMICCKRGHQIRQATYLLKLAVILVVCLIIHLAITILVISLTSKNNPTILYIHTLTACIYDIYPLGFMLGLRCQAAVLARRRRAAYTPLPMSALNASAPASERVSANSDTTPLALEYTGEFTYVEPS